MGQFERSNMAAGVVFPLSARGWWREGDQGTQTWYGGGRTLSLLIRSGHSGDEEARPRRPLLSMTRIAALAPASPAQGAGEGARDLALPSAHRRAPHDAERTEPPHHAAGCLASPADSDRTVDIHP